MLEGNYDEIVAYLDSYKPYRPVQWAHHARVGQRANVGLFSVMDEHECDHEGCSRLGDSQVVNLSNTLVQVPFLNCTIAVEDPEHSHLLRF